MKRAAHLIFGPELVLVLFAAAYGVAMMVVGGASFARLYAPSPYHRLQADAFLSGHFYIGDSIKQMRHDLAWQDGHIQQIWGLGVGMWLTPFELVWRLCGQKWFPDRIALGVAFALLAAYALSAARRLHNHTRRAALGIGFVWLITLCPAVWALNQGGRPVYEETSLYAMLVSLGILTAVVRVACFGLTRDFVICAALAAVSGIVRPTHEIYGLAGILVCSLVLLARRRNWRIVIAGNAAFVCGLVTLALTNWVRFGSPSEFGHRLTVTGEAVVYMTRIGNPMREASLVEAGKELFGWLFLNSRLRKYKSGDDKCVPGQTPYARWRDPYMTTFDPGWAVVCMAGSLGTLVWIRRKEWKPRAVLHLFRRPGVALTTGMFIWAAICTAALVVFYLRFPNMSARYPLDFAPAFVAWALLVWIWASNRWSWIGLPILAVWLGFGILTARLRPNPPVVLKRSEIPTELPRSTGKGFQAVEGVYTLTNHPSVTGLWGNGMGWDKETGLARCIVLVTLDRPQFIELTLGKPDYKSQELRQDYYRAVMDGHFLPLQNVSTNGDRIHVRFDIPETIRQRSGDELLSLCFTPGYDKTDRQSRRMIYSIRWR